MSAYLVSDTTMHRAITALARSITNWHQWDRPYDVDPDLTETLTRLGRRLFALNYKAVLARYGPEPETAAQAAECAAYRYVHQPDLTQVEAYKSLQCLSYQCREGAVPRTALYRTMIEREHAIASVIVASLPVYVAAAWGAPV